MASQTVLFEVSDGVASITLNRPDKLNAMTRQMGAALREALAKAAEPDIRAVLLAGAGRGFCAGQDLAEEGVVPGPAPPDLGAVLDDIWNPLVRAIRALPKPVIAAVHGVAAGAGANLALACDLVLAARSARFIQPFCRLGLIPDGGGSWLLPRLVGEARAKGLALLGEPVSAEQAEAWGLIWRVVEDAELSTQALALARALATQPTIGFALTKQAMHAAPAHSLEAHLDLERDVQRTAGRTPDYAEGVRAFLDKRTPVFTGRPE
jgi:2-(1,2-epoxy-1,2-dihydrophenyl)acetyl-CoA isomerase